MENEPLAIMSYYMGLIILGITSLRHSIKKKEIRDNFMPTYLTISKEFQDTNVYKDPKKFHDLRQIKSKLEQCLDAKSFPSIQEWHETKSLVRKYELKP